MVNGIKNTELQPQEEISKIVLDKIAFSCPHCNKEINETHLDEKGRYFQSIKEKIRKVAEEEVNYQKAIQRKQLLEQLQIEKSYENFILLTDAPGFKGTVNHISLKSQNINLCCWDYLIIY